jgi:hypothetical protein
MIFYYLHDTTPINGFGRKKKRQKREEFRSDTDSKGVIPVARFTPLYSCSYENQGGMSFAFGFILPTRVTYLLPADRVPSCSWEAVGPWD